MTRLKDRKQPSWKVETHPHTGNLTVRRRTFSCLADGEVEEGEEVEDVGECCVDAVVVCCVVIADVVKASYCVRSTKVTRDTAQENESSQVSKAAWLPVTQVRI